VHGFLVAFGILFEHIGLGWTGLGWDELGWDELGWARMSWIVGGGLWSVDCCDVPNVLTRMMRYVRNEMKRTKTYDTKCHAHP